MPLLNPVLDDRTFDELRKELIDRLTVYNREYTDQLPADPVITLLELMASLGETLLFRFNQIPEATRLAFLRLLGQPLRPATPASGLVQFTWKGSVPRRLADASLLIERGETVRAGTVAFAVDRALDVFPLGTRAVVRTSRDLDEAVGGESAAVGAQIVVDSGQDPVGYEVSPVDLATPVILANAADKSIWVALVAEDRTVRAERASINDLLGERVVSIGMSFADDPPEPRGTKPCGASDERGAELRCDALVGRVEAPAGSKGLEVPPIYAPCLIERDTTQGLRRTGVLRLRLPPELSVEPPPVTEAGVGDNPPVLPNAQDDENVVCWVRVRRAGTAQLDGTLRWVGLNATTVTQGEMAPAELAGIGTGDPSQRLALVHRNAVADTVLVEVEEQPGEWVRWSQVEQLATSTGRDRHYVLDAEAGIVRCGDGTIGMPFPAGARVRVRPYRCVAGTAGNVKVGAIARTDAQAGVENPVPTWGGQDPEPLEGALDRIPGEIRRRDRAVTASDFAELAALAPGADVARAEAIPLHAPNAETRDTEGAVTVVVWPHAPVSEPGPMPTRTTLDVVCRYLDERRLATTELYVVAPSYVDIALTVGVEPRQGAEAEAVKTWVRRLLTQYLAPLPPYGPEGAGWPLRRSVHLRELEAVALQVEGVRFINGAALAYHDGTNWVELSQKNELPLGRHQLPALRYIRVDRGAPASPLDLPTNPPSGEPPVLVPFPHPRQEC